MTHILGIDPGSTGAMVLISAYGTICSVEDIPNSKKKTGKKRKEIDVYGLADALLSIKAGYPDTKVFLEDVHSMPNQSSFSVFEFGRSKGVIEGVLAGLDFETHLVSPQAWCRVMLPFKGLDRPKKKRLSRRICKKLWPKWASYFKLVKYSDRADAALIAEYGRIVTTRER